MTAKSDNDVDDEWCAVFGGRVDEDTSSARSRASHTGPATDTQTCAVTRYSHPLLQHLVLRASHTPSHQHPLIPCVHVTHHMLRPLFLAQPRAAHPKHESPCLTGSSDPLQSSKQAIARLNPEHESLNKLKFFKNMKCKLTTKDDVVPELDLAI